jgi:predicted permease
VKRVRNGLLEAWLRLAARLAPPEDRERWLEEWRGELQEARARGLSAVRLLAWAIGVGTAAIRFRGEEMSMDGWGKEVRQALRGLLRRPGFAAVAVLTLGLGIGANTSVFSIVNGVLLRPLPYPEPQELVMVTSAFPGLDFAQFWVSPPEYLELQERARSFSSIGAFRQGQVNVGGGDRPERVTSATASASLFEALGVTPSQGRPYNAQEDLPGADPVVVISHELWQRAFGGDASLVGRTILVSGVSRTVVGIMPPGFDLHEAGIELWLPLAIDPANRTQQRSSHYLYLVGRLAPGITLESASAELASLVAGWDQLNPETHSPDPENHPMQMTSLQEEIVGGVRQALFLLLGAVGFVLLIACANVANLLLVRAEDRHKEVAVRVAMGAGRLQLLRQLLTEGLLLAVLGSAVGLLMAWLSLEGLRALAPGDIPRLGEISLDGRVLFFTTAVALATGAIFGLAPIRHVTRGSPAGGLGEGQRTTAGGARLRLRTLLVTSEMALALMLAVGAGLLVRSFQALTSVDPGFDSEGVLTFQLALPTAEYPQLPEVVAFHERLRDELAAIPGVQQAATMTGLPPLRDLNANDTEFEGVERTENGPPHNVDFYQVASTDYLSTMEIEVREGRGFLPADQADAIPVVLVNETLAQRFYPGQSAVGRRIRPCCGDAIPWFEIVGVVEDVKQAGLSAPAGTELYFHVPQGAQIGVRTFNVVMRTAGSPEALAASAREVVGRLNPSLPLANVRSMDVVLAGARARPRFITLVLGGFAALALILAAVGTYGVMSYSVAQRSKEMGIRMALGAERSSVLRLVMRQGLAVTAAGIGLGLVGAWALTGLLQGLLFEVAPRDLATFVAGPALLGLVALGALWIPARRATRVSPTEVLRNE